MPFAEDRHPVGDLGPGGEHEPFRRAFACGLRGGIFTASIPAPARTASNDAELPGPVADQGPEACGAFAQVHHEVADLLDSSRAVRVCGDPEVCT